MRHTLLALPLGLFVLASPAPAQAPALAVPGVALQPQGYILVAP